MGEVSARCRICPSAWTVDASTHCTSSRNKTNGASARRTATIDSSRRMRVASGGRVMAGLREELLHWRVLKDTAVQFLGFRHGTRSKRLGERPGAALKDVECLVLPTERIATQHRLTVCLLAGRIMCNGLFAEV